MKIESGTPKRSNQKYASTWPRTFILSAESLHEGSRGKIKGNYFRGGMVDPPTSSHWTHYGLNSRENSTLKSQFIREVSAWEPFGLDELFRHELKMVRKE